MVLFTVDVAFRVGTKPNELSNQDFSLIQFSLIPNTLAVSTVLSTKALPDKRLRCPVAGDPPEITITLLDKADIVRIILSRPAKNDMVFLGTRLAQQCLWELRQHN